MILRNFISLRAFTVYMENSLRFEIILRNFISLRAFTVYMEKAEVWNFTSVNLTEVKLAPKWVSLRPKLCERW